MPVTAATSAPRNVAHPGVATWGVSSPGKGWWTSKRSMSLSGPPSARAAEPKTAACTGFSAHPDNVSLSRFHSSRRRSAKSAAAGAATWSRFSSCTRFLPIWVAVTRPCSTRRATLRRIPISEPRAACWAISPTVSGCPAFASTESTGPSRVGVNARVGSLRSTITSYSPLSDQIVTYLI